MNKFHILMLFLIFVLNGCSDKPDPVFNTKVAGTLNNTKVIKKEIHVRPHQRKILVGEGKQKLELTAPSVEMYEAVQKDSRVNLTYNKQFEIIEIEITLRD